MRIAFLAHNYFPVVGGMELATHEIAKRLRRDGHDVKVFVARRPPGSPTDEMIDDVFVSRLISHSMYGRDSGFFPRWMKYTSRMVTAFSRILGAMKEWKPDILHISITPDLILSGLLLSRLLGTPIVVSSYGSDLRGLSEQSWYRNRLTRLILERADYVVTVSRDLEGIATQLVPSVRAKQETIPSGVDYEFFAKRHAETAIAEPYILAIGAMKYVKGHDLLLRAFTVVSKQYPEVRLVIAGDGILYDEMVQLAGRLGIGERVLFWGLANRKELAGLLCGCQFLVMASRSEGMPLSILEAFACGKTVVATRVGGVGEIVVEGETGMLVEPERERALADGIMTLLANVHVRERMGERAREVAKEYDWDQIAERYARAFGTVMSSGGSTR